MLRTLTPQGRPWHMTASLQEPTPESQQASGLKDQHPSPRVFQRNQHHLIRGPLSPLRKAMARSPSQMVVLRKDCESMLPLHVLLSRGAFQREGQCFQVSPDFCCWRLSMTRHSQAVQTFLPPVESLQTCPAQSPLREQHGQNCPFFGNIYNSELKDLRHSHGQKYLVSKPSHEWIPLSLFCVFSFTFKDKK